jgi:ABC-type polysaccharide/polyol phosphate export permease
VYRPLRLSVSSAIDGSTYDVGYEDGLNSLSVSFQDLSGAIKRAPLAAWLAVDDVHGRYRRTVLGPLWITIGQAAMVVGFALVFSGLFGMDPNTYLLYLAAGFPVWTLLSQFLSDMPTAFINAKGFIESYEMPWLVHVWRRAFGYVLVFLHHLSILLVVMLWLGVQPTLQTLYVIPALAIVLVAGVGVGMFVAVVGARYRDLQPAMGVAASFMMLMSPVVWRADQLQVNQWIVRFNPLHYYLEILRGSLLGTPVSTGVWIVTCVGAIVLFGVGFAAFALGRRRLYHWL